MRIEIECNAYRLCSAKGNGTATVTSDMIRLAWLATDEQSALRELPGLNKHDISIKTRKEKSKARKGEVGGLMK